ncbi:pyrethroid hydrolase Ces2a-like [Cylas formicarius]|uniref:pyrethroid hydrolase Ces2a-like n=1 Tax=Cylas formicarius TaxID=197179 RepID=UPI0029588DBC|nr:pyrethroid hydrolase Ces2a-like [Cylas formicarius]
MASNEEVIVVESNYRIGVSGFLSTADDAVLGKAAFKNQLMAMKWTQKNIEYFGEDPEKVTIFCQSAGGMSIGAHLAELYRAAICQSGCSLSKFLLTTQVDPRKVAYGIVKSIDPSFIDQNSTVEIRDFLQSQPTDPINSAFAAHPPLVRFDMFRNPTPDESDPLINLKWPQVSGSFIPYLYIDKDLEVKLAKKVIEMAMWNDVYNNFSPDFNISDFRFDLR